MSLVGEDLTYRVGERALVDGVSLRVDRGSVHAVLGPNGAGKSTLLRLLSGELSPHGGAVRLNGRALDAWTPRDRARQRAVLPQSESLRFAFTVEQVVALGRMPCVRHGDEREARLIGEVLARAGAAPLAQRRYTTLSGGERQRVQLARVLAQIAEPVELGDRFLLLDEPTASLDLAHQHRALRLARELAAEGIGVLLVLHDPNLALSYADRLTLLAGGRAVASGTPAEVLTAETLGRVWGVQAQLLAAPPGPPFIAVRG